MHACLPVRGNLPLVTNTMQVILHDLKSHRPTRQRLEKAHSNDSDASLVFFLYSSLSNDRVYLYTR